MELTKFQFFSPLNIAASRSFNGKLSRENDVSCDREPVSEISIGKKTALLSLH